MIKIFTVYFEGKYRPDYVTKLYHSLKRNCKVPFEFICLSFISICHIGGKPMTKNQITAEYYHVPASTKKFSKEHLEIHKQVSAIRCW